ncbi:MAG: hypothetical protein IH801_04305 [Nitrospinae bacterium]|nr:hypothetical protein [Nitrospinota bacterium]
MKVNFRKILEKPPERAAKDKQTVPDKPAVLHTESSDGWGGQEIRILLEAKELRKRGYNVVLACQEQSGLSREARAAGVPSMGAMTSIGPPLCLVTTIPSP